MANTNKQSTQQRGKMEQRERTQVQAKSTKPKVGHNGGQGNKPYSSTPTSDNKHNKKRKGWENLIQLSNYLLGIHAL
jgi:hypothetical protein